MMQSILWAAGIIGGLGLLFGVVLAVAARFFGVKSDERTAEVRAILPGANCGACGYPGCDGLAAAIARSDAPVNGCPLCKQEAVTGIAGVMGVAAQKVEPMAAIVRCRGTRENAGEKFQYRGIADCAAAAALAEGYKMCRYSCMGMGNCARVCPSDAIHVENGIAVIDPDKCVTCGKCVAACPRGIISLVPASSRARIVCRATARGKEVRDACQAGCIGCGLCAKACEAKAIRMEKDLPVIDFEKCTGCQICVQKCPRHCIRGIPSGN